MVWMEKSLVSQRQEFVLMAAQDGANVRALCRQFGISLKTGYKWINRHADEPTPQALHDRSRRPMASPSRSPESLERAVVELRQAHPAWGGRKIARRLADLGQGQLAPSTVTRILHRHGLVSPQASAQAQPWQRFEHEVPNNLWQIDFKGDFATLAGRCHPLTLLDDHSRFNLLLHAHARTDTARVQAQLEAAFRLYGLPLRINADNGSPWGSPRSGVESGSLSMLAVWLIRLGIRVSFSAPHHPQTNGKIERFHRSFKAEVLAGRNFMDHASAQRAFDAWREVYNCQRPHEALANAVPAQRYWPSALPYPEQLPSIEYPSHDEVVTVGWNGFIKWRGHSIRASTALHRLPIALRPLPEEDGVFEAYFCHQRFMRIDLRELMAET
jgi:transposase InsO family protein